MARLKDAPAQQRRYRLTGTVEPFPGPGGELVQITLPVELDLIVTNAGDFLWAVGEVKAAARLVCSRCLREYTQKLEGRFEEKYRLHGEAADGGGEIPRATDEIDFTDRVMESLVLSLPMKPLCAESCLGLCYYCGKDLNNGKCDCLPENGDPRLAVLKDFKDLMAQAKGGGGHGSTET